MSICKKCNGVGTIKCPECGMINRLFLLSPASYSNIGCLKCNGSGEILCPCCLGINQKMCTNR